MLPNLNIGNLIQPDPHAPAHRYIKVRGGLLHYLEWPGSGRPLLLAHGLNACADIWRHIARDLQGPEQRRLIAVDLRGHGVSARPATGYRLEDYGADLVELIRGLELDQPAYLGLSLGGRLGLYLAACHPGLVGAVGVGDIGADFSADQLAGLTARMNSFPFSAPTLDGYRAEYAKCYPTLPRPTADLWFDASVQYGADGNWQWNAARFAVLETVARWNEADLERHLDKTRCPVLIQKGGASGTLTADQAQHLLGRIPGAKLQVLAGLGHHISLEGPQAYVASVQELLA